MKRSQSRSKLYSVTDHGVRLPYDMLMVVARHFCVKTVLLVFGHTIAFLINLSDCFLFSNFDVCILNLAKVMLSSFCSKNIQFLLLIVLSTLSVYTTPLTSVATTSEKRLFIISHFSESHSCSEVNFYLTTL